jgi:UDP-2-acetamido-3-amino-2,3-dideoxy-glucuronate N-acetyltransferase
MPPASAYFKHESAIVDDGATVGEGSRIWHFCHVASGAVIGRGCVLGQNVYVAPTAVLGDGVRVQNNVSIYDGVVLEDSVFVGPSAVFTNVANPRAGVSRKHAYQKTVVRRGATLGANSTVVCGHTVGSYAFIGAGAVVTHDVPDYALWLGVPARPAGWMCRCGERLPSGATPTCPGCGAGYRLDRGELWPL